MQKKISKGDQRDLIGQYNMKKRIAAELCQVISREAVNMWRHTME